ncbi:MAG: cysteine--tRNA ligase [Acidimicrobiales bacterium]|nr:cysteine--tRNA ligase [Acidimicrobiales bacterium]RZV46142.1 MAG: cysteine--tRNA ligase [Acidimicrobiales bacterium]
MRIYDTLSRKIVDFVPRKEGAISIYACGPTVYDHPHLGHARQAMTYDIARRFFEWAGYDVLHVANITDIDDNIINRATREGLTEPEVAEKWEAIYMDAMAALDILAPHQQPHATEYVQEMIDFIQVLVDNGAAYVTDAGVYLRVRSIEDYGALIHRTHDELAEGAGARVEVDPNKEDPLDFALWKAAKPGEPTWPSPWGDGRPGWHIECAAMSLGILGDGFDLHGGGTDLVFPHHTNERAEAIAAGRTFSRYWMHNAMLNIDGEKMSKSLNNFATIQDVLDEHPLNARALRLMLLQTHYRKILEINAEVIAHARSGIERLDAMIRKAEAAKVDYASAELDSDAVAEFRTQMEDDFGTPEAMAIAFELVRRANGAIDSGDDSAASLVATAIDLTGALGLRIGETQPTSDDDVRIDELVAARTEAKANKDFAEADRIRDELAGQGITIEDTPTGPIWRR